MIIINASGKAHLASSSLCQAYSEEGASIDRRDLQAVCQYLLTGKKDVERDAVCEKPEPIPTEPLRYSEQTGKRSNASVYLLSVIGLVMAGSLFCYFFFPSEKQPSKVAKQQYADYDYQGEILDGKPHGAGTARYHDGRYYQVSAKTVMLVSSMQMGTSSREFLLQIPYSRVGWILLRRSSISLAVSLRENLIPVSGIGRPITKKWNR